MMFCSYRSMSPIGSSRLITANDSSDRAIHQEARVTAVALTPSNSSDAWLGSDR